MKLVAESVEGIRTLAKMLDIPDSLFENYALSTYELKLVLEDYGLSVTTKLLNQYRGTK